MEEGENTRDLLRVIRTDHTGMYITNNGLLRYTRERGREAYSTGAWAWALQIILAIMAFYVHIESTSIFCALDKGFVAESRAKFSGS
jgi:hypothetical protein